MEAGTANREAAARRGRNVAYFTIAWNSVEGLVAVVLGALAGSISLIGFGIDSVIEFITGSVLLWSSSVEATSGLRKRNDQFCPRTGGGRFWAVPVSMR